MLVACRAGDYSASLIARAVEDCNAHLLNLNVTSLEGHTNTTNESDDGVPSYPVVFDIRVNHRDCTGITRSLERYGYTVLAAENAPGADDSTVKDRIEYLLKYLEP